jgi:hypothetical protein
MVVKFYYFLFIILFIGSISGKIHLEIHENGYSAEDKYKYINECISKCMDNHQQGLEKLIFVFRRDHCIQTQCRIYE